MSIEQVVLSNLVLNEEYVRRIIPYLKEEYFNDKADKFLFGLINSYVQSYNKAPTPESLRIELDALRVEENLWKSVAESISKLETDTRTDLDFLIDQTEKFCQDKAICNALRDCINIIDDKQGKLDRGSIPQLLTQALAVSFDSSIGHDYLDDWERRFEYYHRVENRLAFDLEMFNKVTCGGVTPGTLTLLVAGPHVGKSLAMCHMAAANLYSGRNVLYISLEMSEEEISKRIDCNLLDIPIDELNTYTKDSFAKRIHKVGDHTRGKLVVKEYPTAGAGVGNFRHLLNEMRIKKNFRPDVIYVDYLNICSSSRVRRNGLSMYEYVKCVGEELRGLAVEFKLPIISATQINRTGFKASDVDMGDVAESFGSNFTADAMFAMSAPEELVAEGKIMIKQLKNRFGDMHRNTRFLVGVERLKFRLIDVEQDEETGQLGHEPEVLKIGGVKSNPDRFAMLS